MHQQPFFYFSPTSGLQTCLRRKYVNLNNNSKTRISISKSLYFREDRPNVNDSCLVRTCIRWFTYHD